jgi:hypothetical protein
MRRVDNHAMSLARHDNVVHEASAAGDEASILDAPDRLADAELVHGGASSGQIKIAPPA